jgi:hypothetical protein
MTRILYDISLDEIYRVRTLLLRIAEPIFNTRENLIGFGVVSVPFHVISLGIVVHESILAIGINLRL